jgi:hypothetical protein
MTAVVQGFTSVMAQRREPPDAVDYFPTPLWASRALFLPRLSYAWFVWLKTAPAPLRIFWIPPGCRASLTLPDDRRRFAAWTLAHSEAPLFDEHNEERSVSNAGEAQANSA